MLRKTLAAHIIRLVPLVADCDVRLCLQPQAPSTKRLPQQQWDLRLLTWRKLELFHFQFFVFSIFKSYSATVWFGVQERASRWWPKWGQGEVPHLQAVPEVRLRSLFQRLRYTGHWSHWRWAEPFSWLCSCIAEIPCMIYECKKHAQFLNWTSWLVSSLPNQVCFCRVSFPFLAVN